MFDLEKFTIMVLLDSDTPEYIHFGHWTGVCWKWISENCKGNITNLCPWPCDVLTYLFSGVKIIILFCTAALPWDRREKKRAVNYNPCLDCTVVYGREIGNWVKLFWLLLPAISQNLISFATHLANLAAHYCAAAHSLKITGLENTSGPEWIESSRCRNCTH